MSKIVIELYEFTTITESDSLVNRINTLLGYDESVKEIRIEN